MPPPVARRSEPLPFVPAFSLSTSGFQRPTCIPTPDFCLLTPVFCLLSSLTPSPSQARRWEAHSPIPLPPTSL